MAEGEKIVRALYKNWDQKNENLQKNGKHKETYKGDNVLFSFCRGAKNNGNNQTDKRKKSTDPVCNQGKNKDKGKCNGKGLNINAFVWRYGVYRFNICVNQKGRIIRESSNENDGNDDL